MPVLVGRSLGVDGSLCLFPGKTFVEVKEVSSGLLPLVDGSLLWKGGLNGLLILLFNRLIKSELEVFLLVLISLNLFFLEIIESLWLSIGHFSQTKLYVSIVLILGELLCILSITIGSFYLLVFGLFDGTNIVELFDSPLGK